MKLHLPKLLIASLLMAAIFPVTAENTTGLTPEQRQHEQTLSELRKQKEILEVKHSQAKLLQECQEMGIDCRGSNVEVIEQQNTDFSDEISQIVANEKALAMPTTFGNTQSTSGLPKLTAIQNSSANLSFSGTTQWALVGDTVGDWKVVHIDASKVRIKHTGNAKTKTLVLNW